MPSEAARPAARASSPLGKAPVSIRQRRACGMQPPATLTRGTPRALPRRPQAQRACGNAYLSSIAHGTAEDARSPIPLHTQDALARSQDAFERILSEYPDQTLAVGAAKLGLIHGSEERGAWDDA